MAKQIKLTVAYDGTNYCGFQQQNNGLSITAVLNKALSKIAGHDVSIAGVSRTDAGVHAQGQIITFLLKGSIPTAKIPLAVNSLLPDDIVVKEAVEVPLDFCCHRGVVGKHYRYVLRTNSVSDPFDYRYVWHFPTKLSQTKMEQAIKYLQGEHDFKAFTAANSGKNNFVRTLDNIYLNNQNGDWYFDFWGPGFLYKMVRSITGFLVDVGRGALLPEVALQALKTGQREILGYTAPARGLTLVKIYYNDDYYLDKSKNLG